jgi:predicted ATPase
MEAPSALRGGRRDRVEEAETVLQEALRVARKQQAKSYELRAAMSLARLWGK